MTEETKKRNQAVEDVRDFVKSRRDLADDDAKCWVEDRDGGHPYQGDEAEAHERKVNGAIEERARDVETYDLIAKKLDEVEEEMP